RPRPVVNFPANALLRCGCDCVIFIHPASHPIRCEISHSPVERRPFESYYRDGSRLGTLLNTLQRGVHGGFERGSFFSSAARGFHPRSAFRKTTRSFFLRSALFRAIEGYPRLTKMDSWKWVSRNRVGKK